MESQSNGKTNGRKASTPASEASGERLRVEGSRSTAGDPAFVGLCRVMIGLSVLLLVGLTVLVLFTRRSDIDWDASVVQRGLGEEIRQESSDRDDQAVSPEAIPEVIRFDTSRLNSEGLMGPAGGLRALSYEFCIPAAEAHVKEVEAIDPTIAIQRSSAGRIGCREAEYLAIGHTHQPGFREVLMRLSHLPYLDRIEEVHFE